MIHTLLNDQYLRYDAALMLAGGAAAWCVARLTAGRTRSDRPDWWRLFLLLHLLFIIMMLTLNLRIVDSFKKGADSVCALQTAHNTPAGDFSQTIGQTYLLASYQTAEITIFSRTYTILPFVFGAWYAVIPDAQTFLIVQGGIEIVLIGLAGLLLAGEFRRRSNDSIAAGWLLLAWDFCFINGYLSFKEINLYSYSLIGLVIFATALLRGRTRLAWCSFLGTLALHEIHLPVLVMTAAYLAAHRHINWRTVAAYALTGAVLVALVYYVFYPLAGAKWLLAQKEQPATMAQLAATLPALLVALGIFVAVSGGAMLRDRPGLLIATLLLGIPFVMQRAGDWYEFYGGYVRFAWPLPFLALLLAAMHRPANARRLALAALTANVFLAYGFGPLPYTRVSAHRKSPGNLERFSHRGNHDALLHAVALVPGRVPLEASDTLLQRLANRRHAFPLYPYPRLLDSPLKAAAPPEYIAIDFLSGDLLELPNSARFRLYDYLDALLAARQYRTLWLGDYVAVLHVAGTEPATANDDALRSWLRAFRALDTPDWHAMIIANRNGQVPPLSIN